MALSRKLPAPIALDDGRQIASLREAVVFAQALPRTHQLNFHWQYAAEAIQAAAKPRSSAAALQEAARRLIIALNAEGVLGFRTREGAPLRPRQRKGSPR